MKTDAVTPEEFEEIKTIMDEGKELHRKRSEELEERRRQRQAAEEAARKQAKLEAYHQKLMWVNEVEKARKNIQKAFITIFVCVVSLAIFIATTLPTNILLTGLYVERGEIEFHATHYGWNSSLEEAWNQNVELLNQTISNSWYASIFAKSPAIVDFLIILAEIAITVLLVCIINTCIKFIQKTWKNLKEKGRLKHQ